MKITPAGFIYGLVCLKKKIHGSIFFLPVLLTLIASCNQASAEKKRKQAIQDSIAYQQLQQHIEDSIEKADATKKKIYLTFDDGPNDGTLNVFHAAKEEGVAVSFFIVGSHVFSSAGQTAIWQQLNDYKSYELCNHSYYHAKGQYQFFYSNPAGVVKDIKLNQEKVGFNNAVVRMPGRNAWRIDSLNFTDIKASKVAIDSVHKAGFAIMGWDVEWGYSPKTYELKEGAEQIMFEIKMMLDEGKTQTPGHLVVLAHDQEFRSKESIEQLHLLFKLIKENPEYKLVLPGKYPGVKKYDIRNVH
jgi:peptidoglycan-N-acetylglucosamine deacetylase